MKTQKIVVLVGALVWCGSTSVSLRAELPPHAKQAWALQQEGKLEQAYEWYLKSVEAREVVVAPYSAEQMAFQLATKVGFSWSRRPGKEKRSYLPLIQLANSSSDVKQWMKFA